MSEEVKVESKHKLNKKFLLFAIIGIVIVTIVAIISIVPTSARAKEVKEQLSLGDKYLSELNYEQAEATYLAILEIDPKCEEAYIGLANVYIATEQYEKVEEILRKAEEQLGETESIKEKREELERKRKEQEEKLKPTVTNTPMPTATSTPVPTATSTPVPTATSTPIPTATNTPMPTATNTPVPTVTNTPMPTATSTPVPTATNTPVPTATNTPVPTITNTPKPTATSTPIPTATSIPILIVRNTPKPTATPSPTPKLVTMDFYIYDEMGNFLNNSEIILTDELGNLYKASLKIDSVGEQVFQIVVLEGSYTLNISSHGYKSIKEKLVIKNEVQLERYLEEEYMESNYGEIAGHRYQFFEAVDMEFEEVEEFCESLGGYLATISSEIENEFLYKMMKENGFSNAYFGYSDAEEEGVWKWLNGENIFYENWAEGEPNNSGEEDYAMFYYQFTDGKWNDGNFGNGTVNDDKVFICEWDSLE